MVDQMFEKLEQKLIKKGVVYIIEETIENRILVIFSFYYYLK